MEFRALVAFGCESDRQSCAVGEQYELGHPQQCEALIIFQTEVALHPGEMALNIGARIDTCTCAASAGVTSLFHCLRKNGVANLRLPARRKL